MTTRLESNWIRGKKTLDKLWVRDKGICHLCAEPIAERRLATRDHIIPWSQGGRGMRNLALAHRSCNHKRGIMPVDAARAYLRDLKEHAVKRQHGIKTPRPQPTDYIQSSLKVDSVVRYGAQMATRSLYLCLGHCEEWERRNQLMAAGAHPKDLPLQVIRPVAPSESQDIDFEPHECEWKYAQCWQEAFRWTPEDARMDASGKYVEIESD